MYNYCWKILFYSEIYGGEKILVKLTKLKGWMVKLGQFHHL